MDTIGRTTWYINGKAIDIDKKVCDQAVCVQYKIDSFTKSNRVATATHEIGHALSLKDNNSNVYATCPIKRQGKRAVTN